ncbi:MAG: sterol desaturase family protein [Gammaproteobacteria bacterium]|nr:sterol desaturase family protein [Gammaproteobacteria bacterium]
MLLIQRYLVLMLVVMSLLLYGMAWKTGVQLEFVILASSILTLIVAWVLERKLPYRRQWNANQGDLATDLTSAAVLAGFIEPLFKIAAPLGVIALYAGFGAKPLLAEWALWHQILFVVLVVEFGKYWSHRLHHEFAPLWWLHALHHSSERMYFLNGLRFHPLNYSINFTLAVFPVMLLGVAPEAILAYLAITQPVVLVQHANIDLRHGWLNRVFSTPEVHRWHHSTQAHEADRNFGNAFLLWDHVFGTFKGAEGFSENKAVGLFASPGSTYPGASGYFSQLASMVKPPCCRG